MNSYWNSQPPRISCLFANLKNPWRVTRFNKVIDKFNWVQVWKSFDNIAPSCPFSSIQLGICHQYLFLLLVGSVAVPLKRLGPSWNPCLLVEADVHERSAGEKKLIKRKIIVSGQTMSRRSFTGCSAGGSFSAGSYPEKEMKKCLVTPCRPSCSIIRQRPLIWQALNRNLLGRRKKDRPRNTWRAFKSIGKSWYQLQRDAHRTGGYAWRETINWLCSWEGLKGLHRNRHRKFTLVARRRTCALWAKIPSLFRGLNNLRPHASHGREMRRDNEIMKNVNENPHENAKILQCGLFKVLFIRSGKTTL